MSADANLQGDLLRRNAPQPARGEATQLNKSDGSTEISAITLAASGALEHSDAIDCESARRLVLLVSYSPGAVGGFPALVPAYSYQAAKPGATDDAWIIPGVWDGLVTGAVLAGALPSGTDFMK